jgi:hypothetical protein
MTGIFQQKYLTEVEDITTPEHCLWISVLSKAAHDAIYSSDWREAKLAIAWFKGMGSGFREVCNYAGKDPNYVHAKMQIAIKKREMDMEMIKSGQRYYVKSTIKFPQHHSHYRARVKGSRGPYKKRKKHLMGNTYYKAKREKDLRMVLQGRKGGRPRMYDGI